MHLDLPRVSYEKLKAGVVQTEGERDVSPRAEPSAGARQRVVAARERQRARLAGADAIAPAHVAEALQYRPRQDE